MSLFLVSSDSVGFLSDPSGPVSFSRFVGSHPEGLVSQQTPPSLRHRMTCHSDPSPANIELLRWQHLGQHVRPVLLRVDLCQRKVFIFYPLPEPVVSSLDVLGPRVVGHVLRKVDGTLTVTVKPEFLLSDSQLSEEVLHPDYFLVGFYSCHIIHFCVL